LFDLVKKMIRREIGAEWSNPFSSIAFIGNVTFSTYSQTLNESAVLNLNTVQRNYENIVLFSGPRLVSRYGDLG
jgi:hypothetical protein